MSRICRNLEDSGKHRFHDLEHDSKMRLFTTYSHTSTLRGYEASEKMLQQKTSSLDCHETSHSFKQRSHPFINTSGCINSELGQLGDNGAAYRRWQERMLRYRRGSKTGGRRSLRPRRAGSEHRGVVRTCPFPEPPLIPQTSGEGGGVGGRAPGWGAEGGVAVSGTNVK